MNDLSPDFVPDSIPQLSELVNTGAIGTLSSGETSATVFYQVVGEFQVNDDNHENNFTTFSLRRPTVLECTGPACGQPIQTFVEKIDDVLSKNRLYLCNGNGVKNCKTHCYNGNWAMVGCDIDQSEST